MTRANSEESVLRQDLGAGVVVALVALPLCLGIALASNAPLLSGLISGIVGGVVVGLLSGSQLSVSGPAAGLALVVSQGIASVGGYPAFLAAAVLAGVFQLVLGSLKLGFISSFFPSTVIKGMLAAIGIIIVLKQIPHTFGNDGDFLGDLSFNQILDHENTFTEILASIPSLHFGALVVALVSMAILHFWGKMAERKSVVAKVMPGALLAVLVGIGINQLFQILGLNDFVLGSAHLVQIPKIEAGSSIASLFVFPDFSQISSSSVWKLAITLALIGSLETLLSLEAVDRLDPMKRTSPVNRELLAQGAGNILASLFGGLPITAVIVRSSANVYAGARSKWSAVYHGLILLTAVVLFPALLNQIPLATLAAVLIAVGYKLSSWQLISSMYKKGWEQFLPFAVTTAAICFTDILLGVGIGWAVSIAFVIRSNFYSAITYVSDGNNHLIRFRKDVSFLNKPFLKQLLESVPEDSKVVVDGSRAMFVDRDVYEFLTDYQISAKNRKTQIDLTNLENKSYDLRFRNRAKGAN